MRLRWEMPKVLGVALVLTVILRLPSLFEPQLYLDEDIYLAMGRAVMRGSLLYRDITDYPNKPPLIYLLAGISGTVVWFRAILMVWSLLCVTIFYDLAGRLLGNKNRIVGICMAVFVVLTSTPLFEGHIANAEIFILLTTVAAWWRVLVEYKDKKVRPLSWITIGGLLGISTLFKLSAVPDIGGVVVATYLLTSHKKLWFTRIVYLVMGVAGVWLLSVGYFVFQGAVEVYIRSILFEFLPYFKSWGGQSTSPGGMIYRIAALGAWITVIWVVRKKLDEKTVVSLSWFGFSLFGALLSARPYPHYLMLTVPALTLLVTLVLVRKVSRLGVSLCISALVMFVAVFKGFGFWSYPVFLPYKLFYMYASSQINRSQYAQLTEGKMAWYPQVIEVIGRKTLPSDKIFVWGNEPGLYVFSKRLGVGKYTNSYHINDLNAHAETAGAIRREKPQMILVSKGEKEFGELTNIIAGDYYWLGDIGEVDMYTRLKGSGEL